MTELTCVNLQDKNRPFQFILTYFEETMQLNSTT